MLGAFSATASRWSSLCLRAGIVRIGGDMLIFLNSSFNANLRPNWCCEWELLCSDTPVVSQALLIRYRSASAYLRTLRICSMNPCKLRAPIIEVVVYLFSSRRFRSWARYRYS